MSVNRLSICLLSVTCCFILVVPPPHTSAGRQEPQVSAGEGETALEGAGPGEDLRITINGDTIEDLILAVVPYELELNTGLFLEVVTLTDPRDIRLVPGGIHLKMTATGSPVPFVADVSPDVRLVQDSETGGYVVAVQEMPVDMGPLGTYDLASFIDPIPIEKVSHYFLEMPGRMLEVELIVRGIEVSEEGIVVRLQTDFP